MASQDGSSSGTLSQFLRESKAAYLDAAKTGKGRDWTVVMGNEAGDLDSIASAIGFAWYAAKVQGTLAVSLTQTPRTELHLRAENAHALALAHLDADTDILCADDIPVPASQPFPSNRFALVDHNRLQARFARENPDARVVAVVDHHEDEGLYKDTADPRLIVVPTGSCASLVTRLFEENPEKLSPELATLLLCSVLIDTNGLKQGGKAEEADRRAAAFLVPLASVLRDVSGAPDFTSAAPEELADLQTLNVTLQEKKASVAHLNTLDLLRRDYKEYALSPASAPSQEVLVGLSSVPIGFKQWLPRHADFFTQTEQFMADRGLAVLGILTSFRDEEHPGKSGRGKHRREQMYVVRGDAALADALFEALEENEELKLERKKFPDYGVHKGFGQEFKARVWKQKNVDATRKATAPIVKSIVEGRPKGASL